MDRRDLSAASWFASRAKVAAIVGLGVLFALEPESMVKALGGPDRWLGLGLLVAFALLASLAWKVHEQRIQVAERMEALHQLLYGKDYARDREAIEILLVSLEGADPEAAKTAYAHLCRLTGQNFAQDPKVWRSWWEAHKRTFQRARGGPGDGGA